MNALIVGSSAATDQILLEALADRFEYVRMAATSSEALELAAQLRPDLVITARGRQGR